MPENQVEQILKEMTQFEVRDRYAHRSPGDSPQWLDLFMWSERAAGARLAEILQEIRGRGSVLVRHNQFGYMIQPEIGPWTWSSQSEYDQAKAPLMQYVTQLIELLKRLREVHP